MLFSLKITTSSLVLAFLVSASLSSDSTSHRRAIVSGKARLAEKRQVASVFPPLDYSVGQISDGVAGNAQEDAAAVCVEPFEGINLADVSSADLENLKTFREDAEAAETDLFNPAIEAASGAEQDALENGKIANKVLKLTCFNQVLRIQQAQGRADAAAKIAEEQTKLDKNIATDESHAGESMQGVTGGSSQGSNGQNGGGQGAIQQVDNDAASEVEEPAQADTEDNSQAGNAQAGSQSLFPPLAYAQGQISDGTAGNAEAAAQAVCVQPFAGVDLATVSAEDLGNLKAFREAAEDAETEQFNPVIDAATGDAADALENGKIANKVLKLTCFQQALEIDAAQGKDVAAKLAEEQGKLAKNIATDRASAGEPQQGVTGGQRARRSRSRWM